MPKDNTRRCSLFKETITSKMSGLLSHSRDPSQEYYSVMGYAIQQLHESKKIDYMCRSFLQHDLRKYFIENNKDRLPSEGELSLYNHYSKYHKSLISADFKAGRIMAIEGVSYEMLDEFAFKMDKAFKSQKQDEDNIPKTVHHIWLTKASKARELFEADIKNVISTKKFFAQGGEGWSHVVWTNDKDLIPNSVKKLESNGVQVRSIYDYQDELKLFDQIIELTQKGRYGMASDTLRLSIIWNEGGVYADLNFGFEQSITGYLEKYDFFCGDFQNNFFAARSGHPIIRGALEKIQENLANPPSYLNNLVGKVTIEATHLPFVLSILKHANDGENVDFYGDYCYTYGLKCDSGPIGQDNVGTRLTWAEDL